MHLIYRFKHPIHLILKLRFVLTAVIPVLMYCMAYGDDTWLSLESRHTILYYKFEKNLERFNTNVHRPGRDSRCLNPFLKNHSKLEISIINKIDAIFLKVQHILDMEKEMDKVKIYLYPNKHELHDAYFKIYHKRDKHRAWYIYEYNAIYMNVRDLHEGMLAHEFAHAVIDNYFSAPPPRAAAEILARYVDGNLFEDVKKYK